MKKIILLSLLTAANLTLTAQKDKPLVGRCSVSDLAQEPYATWYTPGYTHYSLTEEVINQLKKLNLRKLTVKIVFGSWCGDSRREIPRMMKTLHTAGVTDKNIELIGVYDSLAVYKQAPNREEKGLTVYRVPTLIVYEKEKELGRIVEYPVESLERDLLKIISGQPYTYNYKGFEKINTWLAQGLLSDPNINARGLAQQIRTDISRESELNSCGYVLLAQQAIKEAITVFTMNVNLYPQSSNCYDSLGEAYLMAGMKENAKACYEYAVELNPENTNAKTQLEKLN